MRIRITSESGVLTGMVDADQRMDGVAEDPCFGLLLITLCMFSYYLLDGHPTVSRSVRYSCKLSPCVEPQHHFLCVLYSTILLVLPQRNSDQFQGE